MKTSTTKSVSALIGLVAMTCAFMLIKVGSSAGIEFNGFFATLISALFDYLSDPLVFSLTTTFLAVLCFNIWNVRGRFPFREQSNSLYGYRFELVSAALLVFLYLVYSSYSRFIGISLQANELQPSNWTSQIFAFQRYLATIVSLYCIWASFRITKGFKKNMRQTPWTVPMIAAASVAQLFSGVSILGNQFLPLVASASSVVLFLLVVNTCFAALVSQNWSINKSAVNDFYQLCKPRLSMLVVVTCTVGVALAPGEISLFKAIVSVISTAMIVAGACVVNCYMERDIDKLMKRTKDRPLPANRMPANWALYFGVLLIVIFHTSLFVFVNTSTALLGLIATVTYVALYTPMKTRSWWALFVGAIPGAIPPFMGWTTVTNSFDMGGWALFGILFFWQLPHFLAISIFNAQDYRNAGIKIFANKKGVAATKQKVVTYTLLMLVASFVPVLFGVGSRLYLWLAGFLGAAFLIYSFYGLLLSDERKALNEKWAKNYFLASILYLPSILTIMVFL